MEDSFVMPDAESRIKFAEGGINNHPKITSIMYTNFFYLSFLISFCLLNHNAQAQIPNVITLDNMGKAGVVDAKTHKIHIPFKYDDIYHVIADSVYVVKRGAYYGVVDIHHKTLVETEYNFICLVQSTPKNVYFRVTLPEYDKLGLIDLDGDLIVKFGYDAIGFIDSSLIWATTTRDTLVHFFDLDGKFLYRTHGIRAYSVAQNDAIGIVYDNLSLFDPQRIRRSDGKPFYDGKFPNMRETNGVIVIAGKTKKVGMATVENDTLLPFTHENIYSISQNRYVVVKDGRSWLVDQKGRALTEADEVSFDRVLGNQCKFIWRRSGRFHGSFYDFDGNLLVQSGYVTNLDLVEKYHTYPELFIIQNKETSKCGVLECSGKFIIPMEYEFIDIKNRDEPILAVKRDLADKKQGIAFAFDLDGKKIIEEPLKMVNRTEDAKVLVGIGIQNDTLMAFFDIDSKTNTLFEYRHAEALPNRYRHAMTNGMCTLYDKDMNKVHSGTYDRYGAPDSFHLALCKKENITQEIIAIGYSNTNGNSAIDTKGRSFKLKGDPYEGADKVAAFEDVPYRTKIVRPVVELKYATVKLGACAGRKDWFYQALSHSVKYPEEAKLQGLKGEVIVSFQSTKYDKPSSITVVKDIGGGCGKAAIDFLSMFSWQPTQIERKEIPTQFNISINFGK